MRLAVAFCMSISCLLVVAFAHAQDVDTIVFKNENQKFTLLSQIQDPAEASAFLSAFSATESASRYGLASKFVKAYPQSWLLPQAYDLSARSAIELGKYDEALADGRMSIRLLRENPSLLILLANIEAQKNLPDDATRDASDALEYLDQIERPPNMSQAEWTGIKPQLKSSAYFARARVNAAAGGTNQAKQLRSAFDDLNKAAAWNEEDAEMFYLRAIVEIKLGDKRAAAADMAFVSQSESPLHEKAASVLKILLKEVTAYPARAVDMSLRQEDRAQTQTQALSSGYAGPEACRSCHTNEYAAWRKTGMARMLQPYSQANIIGDFSKTSHFTDPDVIRMGFEGRPYFEISNLGKWSRYYVDFTIGSKWQQGYATKLPDGRLQVVPIEYNLLQKQWINYWKIIDPPGSQRAIIQDFPKLTTATNYQQNCAICHTSQLKLDTAAANSMEHAVYLQPGIDCEMCHGPAAWHIKQIAKGDMEHSNPVQPPFDFKKADNRDSVRVCAQCHRQSAVREIGEAGEMNYASKTNFVATTFVLPYDAFSRKAFYKDGRFRETTFIVDAFVRSACYRRGTAQCATCHSPHLADFDSNKTSLKFAENPNEMCLQCHSEYRSRIAEHSRHAANTEASQCVSCHMPRIMNALLFKAPSHEIEVPTADLTERFGQQESPNVCLTCHSEKGVGWAKDQLVSWQH